MTPPIETAMSTCSIAETDHAEDYALRRLSASDNEQYEEHLLVCPQCRVALEQFEVFLSAARIVLDTIPADCCHIDGCPCQPLRTRRHPATPR